MLNEPSIQLEKATLQEHQETNRDNTLQCPLDREIIRSAYGALNPVDPEAMAITHQ